MLLNYLKIACRNIVKSKTYSIINITGMAVGLAVGILILLWVTHEFSFDRFHRNINSIYKVNCKVGTLSGDQTWGTVPAGLNTLAKQSVPEIAQVVRIRRRDDNLLFGNDATKLIENNTAYVDSSFFSVFDFQPINGSKQNPFSGHNAVVLTSSLAKKYFGNIDAVGKTLLIEKENFLVTAVIPDFPQNSSINFTALFPMGLFEKWLFDGGNGKWLTPDQDLDDFSYDIYFQLTGNSSATIAGKKINAAYVERTKEKPDDNFTFILQPLSAVHLTDASGNNAGLQTVNIFLIIGILILVIAGINYVNLSTARAMIRSKEVCTRKIIGARRIQLFFQFMTESAVLFVLAALLAFIVVLLLLPVYNTVSGKQLSINFANNQLWLIICIAVVATLLLSAVYPAILLSSFKPLDAFRRKMVVGSGVLRKILVVTQFIFSVGLIIATIVVGKQLTYIREKNIGYNKDYVFSFVMRDPMRDHYVAIRSELLQQPGIFGVASSFNSIVNEGAETSSTHWEGKPQNSSFVIKVNGMDKDLMPLLNMQLVAGKNFSGSKTDSAHFILNETAILQAGITDPIGKTFKLWDTKGTIIGVVKDFHIASLKEKIEPAIFYHGYPLNYTVYVKTTGRDAAKAIAAAAKAWKQYSPGYPFEYSFLDETVSKLYRSDQQTGKLFNAFAAVAIFISCLGLFGLATFTAQVKTKEIGIRKILGASAIVIASLLSKDFLKLVLIGFMIASPVSWWIMHRWLQHFAYRIDIGWWIFIASGLLTTLIALATVSLQTIKAAIANPVKALRME